MREREAMEMEKFFRLAEIYSNCDTFDLKKRIFGRQAWPSEKFEKMGSPLSMIHENRGYSPLSHSLFHSSILCSRPFYLPPLRRKGNFSFFHLSLHAF